MSQTRIPVRSARGLAAASLMAGLTAVGAILHLPVPYVPFTLQPVFVCLAGVWLGARLGAFSQVAYLAAGLAGLPVFVGGGGMQYVLEPTFGYLLGFPLAAWTVGTLADQATSYRRHLIAVEAGLTVLYLTGVPWLYLNLRYLVGQTISPMAAAALGLAPWPKDLLLGLGVAWLARRVQGLRRLAVA